MGLVSKSSRMLLPAAGSSLPSTPPLVSRLRRDLEDLDLIDVLDDEPPRRRILPLQLLICAQSIQYRGYRADYRSMNVIL